MENIVLLLPVHVVERVATEGAMFIWADSVL